MNPITLDHIRAACQWAITAGESPQPIDGLIRKYRQSQWDCGTSCCVWGAAHIQAGNGPANTGPGSEWSKQSLVHTLVAGLMNTGTATPERMIDILDRFVGGAAQVGANLSDADLSDASLSGVDLSGANLSGANLRGANLSDASLVDASLSDASLVDANLSDADLSDASLSGVDLRGANLRGANLRGASLSGASVLIGNVHRKLQ